MDGSAMYGLGCTPQDAAAQADHAMRNARVLVEEAGGNFENVCKLRVYIGDRTYLEAV